MLLADQHQGLQPRKVVQYFEVLKEKAPELVITVRRDPGRSAGPTATSASTSGPTSSGGASIEASYLEDARVGEVLRQRGKTLEGIAYLLDLWREYPDTASIESDFFGLSQVLARPRRPGDRPTRPSAASWPRRGHPVRAAPAGDPADPGRSSPQSPRNPLADEASLALVGAFLELEDFEAVVKLAAPVRQALPQEHVPRQLPVQRGPGPSSTSASTTGPIEVAETIAAATYKDANGVDQPSPNKWQALYILGQIYDARRQPAKALDVLRAGRRPVHRRRRRGRRRSPART